MISDVLSDAIGGIHEYQQTMPDVYGDFADEIAVVTTVMDALRMYFDAAPSMYEEHGTFTEALRRAVAEVDVRDVQAARGRFLQLVQQLRSGKPAPEIPMPGGWQPLGFVTIDTARMLLVDPVHAHERFHDADVDQLAIPGGDYSAVQVGTGIGDGRYLVEGRVVDGVFGRRLGEIRVRFLDEQGNWLGADQPSSESEA
jgi:hypothetical protein